MITERIYLGRDNINEILVKEDGADVDFSGVTRMVLEFEGSGVSVDSALSNVFINWSAGKIILQLGELVIPPGRYPGTLVAYDLDHDDGQVIFHAVEGKVLFWFIEA